MWKRYLIWVFVVAVCVLAFRTLGEATIRSADPIDPEADRVAVDIERIAFRQQQTVIDNKILVLDRAVEHADNLEFGGDVQANLLLECADVHANNSVVQGILEPILT